MRGRRRGRGPSLAGVLIYVSVDHVAFPTSLVLDLFSPSLPVVAIVTNPVSPAPRRLSLRIRVPVAGPLGVTPPTVIGMTGGVSS